MSWQGPNRAELLGRLGKFATSTWLLAGLITLLSWAALPERPLPGIDTSTMTAFHLAAANDLNFGTQITLTFGPLGFLTSPLLIYPGIGAASLGYELLVRFALATTLLWTARRSFPLALAFALALGATAIILGPPTLVGLSRGDPVVIIAFIWCVVALAPSAPRFSVPLLVYGGGAVSAAGALTKVSSGLVLLALCGLAILALGEDRRANALRFAETYAATLVLLWLLTGQSFLAFDDYVRSSWELTSGYAIAMTTEASRVGRDELVAVAISLGAFYATAIACVRRVPSARLVILGLIVATFVAFEVKDAFVRHDVSHASRFPAAMLAPWFAYRWIGAERFVALFAVIATMAVWFPISGSRPSETFTPIDNAETAFRQARDFLLPGYRERARDAARAALIEHYALSPEAIALLRHQSVHVEPFEVSLIWAYDLEWRPLPDFQTFATYTSELDETNARFLESDEGPTRIVRYAGGIFTPPNPVDPRNSIDGRYAPFDAPAQTQAILCNYRVLLTTPIYQVLGKAENRCGEPRSIGSVDAEYGETVPVPRPSEPNQVVFARVTGLEPSGLERLRVALYRASPRYVTLNGVQRYRMVPGTAKDGLMLRIGQGEPRGQYALAPNADTISFERDSGFLTSGDDLRIDFYSMTLAKPA